MEQPLVSICISCYNHEKYVRQALESAIDQTYSNLEIIITDDGSSDRSREIIREVIKEHPDKNIRTIFSEVNTAFAVVEEMNLSFRGKYMGGFSADDYWGNTVVETYVNYMEDHPACAVSFTAPEVIVEQSGVVVDFWEKNISRFELFELLLSLIHI